MLVNIQPFAYRGLTGNLPRGKINLDMIEGVKKEVKNLIQEKEGKKAEKKEIFEFLSPHSIQNQSDLLKQKNKFLEASDIGLLKVSGEGAKPFLQEVSTADITKLKPGDITHSFFLDAEGKLIDEVSILRLAPDKKGKDYYLVVTTPSKLERVKIWLEALSDGYIIFDPQDIFAKIQGPVVVEDLKETREEVLQKLEKTLKVNPAGIKLTEYLHLRKKFPSAEREGCKIDGLSLYKNFPS